MTRWALAGLALAVLWATPPCARAGTLAIDALSRLDTLEAMADPEAPPPPFPERLELPERVLLVGSSSMQWGFGTSLAEHLEAFGVGTIRNEARMSTGLARLDFHDWLGEVQTLLHTVEPDLLIAQFGGNDCQALRAPDRSMGPEWKDEAAWNLAYAERVRRLVSLGRVAGVPVVVVGMPQPDREGYAGRLARVMGVIEGAVEAEGGLFIPTWPLTSHDDGTVRTHAEIDGRRRRLHQGDRVHLSVAGARWVASHVASTLMSRFDRQATCALSAEDDLRGTCPVEPLASPGPRRPRAVDGLRLDGRG